MKRTVAAILNAACVIAVGACITLAALTLVRAQNSTVNVLTTLLGSELIQAQSPTNTTAAIAYTTVASLRDGRDYLISVPTTGGTVTMTTLQSALILNPAGGLSTLTVVLPPTATDGKTVTIFSTQNVTTLTMSTSNGATINQPQTSLTANSAAQAWVYSLANTAWYRFM